MAIAIKFPAGIVKQRLRQHPIFLGMQATRGTMWLGRARWVATFCGVLISPAILVYGMPLAIGAGVDAVTIVAAVL